MTFLFFIQIVLGIRKSKNLIHSRRIIANQGVFLYWRRGESDRDKDRERQNVQESSIYQYIFEPSFTRFTICLQFIF